MNLAACAPPFAGRLVMLGFGCIGQGSLPLLLRHTALLPEQIRIVSAHGHGRELADGYGVHLVQQPVGPGNLREVLEPLLGAGDFLLNLSVDVSSCALVEFCRERGALYLDTCIEPWAGGCVDRDLSAEQRSNYMLREEVLALRSPARDGPTAVLAHGANPGLVSHLVKQALVDLAEHVGTCTWENTPGSREAWARLARCLGVRCIHIAERDTQRGRQPKDDGEFVNTWSVDAFVHEACQPAELGWGTHERHFPPDGARHADGSRSAIYLLRPGAATQVRSWTPSAGAQIGHLISHSESISIAELLTLGDPTAPEYRPTVHYAYRPCNDALLSLHELAERNWAAPLRQRILKDEITSGFDELGVLLMGPAFGTYWYGSTLTNARARCLVPHNSATSLQVTAAVTAGVRWAMQHPRRDVVEADDLPYDEMLAFCAPYLGELHGEFSHWTPLQDRNRLFDEDLALDDPWQFKNFRAR